MRRTAQIVFQNADSSLNPRKTVAEIVGRPLRRFAILPPAEVAARVKTLLDLVRLPAHYAERYPHQMSGGEKQRVGIARALATGPGFIVCDEPVSALDVSVQAAIVNLLADLRDDLGVAYLFISHDISVVAHLADRIAVMYRGSDRRGGPRRGGVTPPAASLHGGAAVGRAQRRGPPAPAHRSRGGAAATKAPPSPVTARTPRAACSPAAATAASATSAIGRRRPFAAPARRTPSPAITRRRAEFPGPTNARACTRLLSVSCCPDTRTWQGGTWPAADLDALKLLHCNAKVTGASVACSFPSSLCPSPDRSRMTAHRPLTTQPVSTAKFIGVGKCPWAMRGDTNCFSRCWFAPRWRGSGRLPLTVGHGWGWTFAT